MRKKIPAVSLYCKLLVVSFVFAFAVSFALMSVMTTYSFATCETAHAAGKKARLYDEVNNDKHAKDIVAKRIRTAIKRGDRKASCIVYGNKLLNMVDVHDKQYVFNFSDRARLYKYGVNNYGLADNITGVFVYSPNDPERRHPIYKLKTKEPYVTIYYEASKKQWKKAKTKAQRIAKGTKKKRGKRAKLKYIHDTLCKTISYDNGKHRKWNNKVHALCNGKTMCLGYAQAFNMVCYYTGITSQTVEGKTCTGGLHAWNRVKIGGKWKYVDVCWDDTGSTKGTHTYFLKSKSFMNRSRTTNNYYW